MVIPVYRFLYTIHACIVVESSHIWVRFESDSRQPNPDQEYHCRCSASNKIYIVLGKYILTPRIEHTELISEGYQEIPADWSVEQIFQHLGVPITFP
ncbi:MAG: hypothetical protein RLZZ223_657 [Candidatus Parcubacteria bacterium]|jgi:hypothetical protein